MTEETKKNNSALLWVILVVLLVALGALGYLYWNQNTELNELVEQMTIEILQGRGYEYLYGPDIAPDGKITRSSYTVQPDYSIYSNRWFGSYLCGWDKPEKGSCSDEDYLMLIELCGYYGADPETVQYLRDLGYSYTEIEDFLMYPESYGAELALAEL